MVAVWPGEALNRQQHHCHRQQHSVVATLRPRLKVNSLSFNRAGRNRDAKGDPIPPKCLLHFVAFLHVASLFSTGVDNKKALELTNSTLFYKGRQWLGLLGVTR